MMLVHLASVLTGCSTKGSMCPQKRPQNCTLMKSTPSYATNYFTFLVATCLPMLRLPHFTLAFFSEIRWFSLRRRICILVRKNTLSNLVATLWQAGKQFTHVTFCTAEASS
uniref:Uncharacterized protein n=1 Tax=Ixodes ricinus TaxID=34613 RepID=A0A147BF25_IXORI